MDKVVKSAGQVLLERVMAYMGRYVHFGAIRGTREGQDGQLLVVALWIVHTWLSDKFPSTAFLHVSAASSSCGKSMTLEVLAPVVRCAVPRATVRPLELVRRIEAMDGCVTLLLDQCERFASDRQTEELTLLATGQRKGQLHAMSVGSRSVDFRTFAPRAFASIGDLTEVLRSRCIPVYLERGKPTADFYAELGAAEDNARGIASALLHYGSGCPVYVMPDFLRGRDREIWSPLWSIALDLSLSDAVMGLLKRTMIDLTESKKLEPRAAFSSVAEADAKTGDDAVTLLRDLQSVCREGEKRIGSAEAVKRLLAIDVAPWRAYRGGLTPATLAELVARFGLYPVQRRVKVSGRVASYDVSEIQKARG